MAERTASVAGKAASSPPTAGLLLQRKCACGTHTPGGGECAECARKRLQRKPDGVAATPAIPPSVHGVLGSAGRPLDGGTRQLMEQRFGQDFSGVRVHADASAAASARAVGALAYTVGRDVVFAEGQYAPQSRAGRRLLAHELAHVVQQRHMRGSPQGIDPPDSALEREADAAADRIAAGGAPPMLARARAPLLAREVDRRSMVAPDRARIDVERVVTPGHCALGPETRTATSGDITASSAFLQIDMCRGSVAGGVHGEIDYGSALQSAGQAVGNLLSGVASGQPSSQALSTFANALRQLRPEARVSVNLQASDVFRLDLAGTGGASVAGGASGQATARAQFDVGPVQLVVEGSVSGGAHEPTRYQITGGVVFGGAHPRAPDCRVCQCSQPRIEFRCTRHPPQGQTPTSPPSPRPQRRLIPYFFEYSDIAPNRRLDSLNRSSLREAVDLIRGQDYRIARIEGSASPEGPEAHPRGRFRNNTRLAQARAEEAQRQLRDAIRREIASALIMRTERLQRELSSSYPVVGRAELFGRGAGGEVADPALFAHLQQALQPPQPGSPDPLAQEHVIGAGLSPTVLAETEADVEAFRTGRRGRQRLTREQRLQAIYEPLRRALIALEPPPLPPPDLRLSQAQVQQIIGTPITCTAEHRALFADVPIQHPFEGECSRPGERPDQPHPRSSR